MENAKFETPEISLNSNQIGLANEKGVFPGCATLWLKRIRFFSVDSPTGPRRIVTLLVQPPPVTYSDQMEHERGGRSTPLSCRLIESGNVCLMVETLAGQVPTCQETQIYPRPAINFLPEGGLTGSGWVLTRSSGRARLCTTCTVAAIGAPWERGGGTDEDLSEIVALLRTEAEVAR